MTETPTPPSQSKDFTVPPESILSHLCATLGASSDEGVQRPSSPAMLGDIERAEYLAMLNGEYRAAIPEDKANGILDALWQIMNAFVDLGFGIGIGIGSADGSITATTVATGRTEDTASPCGKLPQNLLPKCDKTATSAVEFGHQTTTQDTDTRPSQGGLSGRES